MNFEKKKKKKSLSKRFKPQFWQDVDSRLAFVKEITRRYEFLKEEAGVDSYQKDLLAQRTIFMAVQLETMEREAVEKGEFDAGRYTQAVNCFVGLLRMLGLERKMQKAVDLKRYIEGKTA